MKSFQILDALYGLLVVTMRAKGSPTLLVLLNRTIPSSRNTEACRLSCTVFFYLWSSWFRLSVWFLCQPTFDGLEEHSAGSSEVKGSPWRLHITSELHEPQELYCWREHSTIYHSSRCVFDNLGTIFLSMFLHKTCGYILESPRWGDSNEYLQYTFLWRNMEFILYLSPNINICSSQYHVCVVLQGQSTTETLMVTISMVSYRLNLPFWRTS